MLLFVQCLLVLPLFVCLFGLVLYVPVNSYGHVGMVTLPNHMFSCSCAYFPLYVHEVLVNRLVQLAPIVWVICVISSFAAISLGEERADCFTLILF